MSEGRRQRSVWNNVISNNLLKVETKQTDGFVRSNFVDKQHAYLSNFIRFADAKAGALVTINGIILKFVTDMIGASNGYSGILFKLSLLLLILSILISVTVVFPKRLNSKEKGIVYWEHIHNYGKEAYMKAITEGDAQNLLISSIENNFIQATILTRKFKHLVLGFKVSMVSYVVIAVALLLKFLYKK
ncbi:Pycsar system effector family protein [Bacillus sp. N9]